MVSANLPWQLRWAIAPAEPVPHDPITLERPGVTRAPSELTRAIRQGDRDAFTEFYRRHVDFVLESAKRISRRDESTCLDLAQEVFIRVIRKLPMLETEDQARKWLYCVTCSCLRDQLRAQLRRDRREHSAARRESAEEPALEAREQLNWLNQELASVPADERRMLALRFEQGWTLQRIGEALGLNAGAVDGRIRRLLGRLRKQAEKEIEHDR
jgi:RNA polymerase sigma-70 factor, ECF subfamily